MLDLDLLAALDRELARLGRPAQTQRG
ncbi:MAG: hypothetical protein RLZZ413_2627, partial [Pseudomonadota bacterium]